MENKSSDCDAHHRRKGLQAILNYTTLPVALLNTPTSLPDKLKKKKKLEQSFCSSTPEKVVFVLDSPTLPVTVVDLNKRFRHIKSCKVAIPDGIPSHIIKSCTNQPSEVFSEIFNLSLSLCLVHFKRITIMPVLKTNTVSCLWFEPL